MDESVRMKERVWDCLRQVKDPELSSVSIVDMGMVEDVRVEDSAVTISVIPTYIGCPALPMIRDEAVRAVRALPEAGTVRMDVLTHPPWTSDRITPDGRRKLRDSGIAPPPVRTGPAGMWTVECPYCASPKTVMQSVFGPAACRSLFYCGACKNPFEAIKPI